VRANVSTNSAYYVDNAGAALGYLSGGFKERAAESPSGDVLGEE
jgi:hypothetical protein